MKSMSVVKSDMALLGQDQLTQATFGALCQSFAMQILNRSGYEDGMYQRVALEFLDETAEEPMQPVKNIFNIDLSLVLETIRKEAQDQKHEKKETEKLLEQIIRIQQETEQNQKLTERFSTVERYYMLSPRHTTVTRQDITVHNSFHQHAASIREAEAARQTAQQLSRSADRDGRAEVARPGAPGSLSSRAARFSRQVQEGQDLSQPKGTVTEQVIPGRKPGVVTPHAQDALSREALELKYENEEAAQPNDGNTAKAVIDAVQKTVEQQLQKAVQATAGEAAAAEKQTAPQAQNHAEPVQEKAEQAIPSHTTRPQAAPARSDHHKTTRSVGTDIRSTAPMETGAEKPQTTAGREIRIARAQPEPTQVEPQQVPAWSDSRSIEELALHQTEETDAERNAASVQTAEKQTDRQPIPPSAPAVRATPSAHAAELPESQRMQVTRAREPLTGNWDIRVTGETPAAPTMGSQQQEAGTALPQVDPRRPENLEYRREEEKTEPQPAHQRSAEPVERQAASMRQPAARTAPVSEKPAAATPAQQPAARTASVSEASARPAQETAAPTERPLSPAYANLLRTYATDLTEADLAFLTESQRMQVTRAQEPLTGSRDIRVTGETPAVPTMGSQQQEAGTALPLVDPRRPENLEYRREEEKTELQPAHQRSAEPVERQAASMQQPAVHTAPVSEKQAAAKPAQQPAARTASVLEAAAKPAQETATPTERPLSPAYANLLRTYATDLTEADLAFLTESQRMQVTRAQEPLTGSRDIRVTGETPAAPTMGSQQQEAGAALPQVDPRRPENLEYRWEEEKNEPQVAQTVQKPSVEPTKGQTKLAQQPTAHTAPVSEKQAAKSAQETAAPTERPLSPAYANLLRTYATDLTETDLAFLTESQRMQVTRAQEPLTGSRDIRVAGEGLESKATGLAEEPSVPELPMDQRLPETLEYRQETEAAAAQKDREPAADHDPAHRRSQAEPLRSTGRDIRITGEKSVSTDAEAKTADLLAAHDRIMAARAELEHRQNQMEAQRSGMRAAQPHPAGQAPIRQTADMVTTGRKAQNLPQTGERQSSPEYANQTQIYAADLTEADLEFLSENQREQLAETMRTQPQQMGVLKQTIRQPDLRSEADAQMEAAASMAQMAAMEELHLRKEQQPAQQAAAETAPQRQSVPGIAPRAMDIRSLRQMGNGLLSGRTANPSPAAVSERRDAQSVPLTMHLPSGTEIAAQSAQTQNGVPPQKQVAETPVDLTYNLPPAQANTPPQDPVQQTPSAYFTSLPKWAQDFVKNSGTSQTAGVTAPISAAARSIATLPTADTQMVDWSSPQREALMRQATQKPAEVTFKEKNQTEQQPRPVQMSEAELRRTADKVYKIIEDRIRRERRLLGL